MATSGHPIHRSFSHTRQSAAMFAGIFATASLLAVAIYGGNGPLLLGVAVLVGMVVVLLRRPTNVTVVVTFVLYSNVTAAFAKHVGAPTWLAAALFGLLAVPLAQYLVVERKGLITNRVLGLMVAYLGCLIASALLSRVPDQSTDKLITYTLEGLVLFFLLINTVRTSEVLRKVLWSVVIAGVLMGGVSIYQEVTRTFRTTLFGMGTVDDKQIGTGQSDRNTQKITRPRVAGSIGEPNRYAQLMLVLLPITFVLARSEPSRRMRILASASMAPILAGMVLTYSRGAAVALALLLLMLLLGGYMRVRHVIGFGALALVLVVYVAPDIVHRVTTLARLDSIASWTSRGADSSMRERATLNVASFRMFLDHPILGVGPGQAKYYMTKYGHSSSLSRIQGTRRAHSMYLEELASTGIIGFGFFAAILVVTVRGLLHARRHLRRVCSNDSMLATGLLYALCAYLVTALFLHLSYERYFWFLVAVSVAAARIWMMTSPAAPLDSVILVPEKEVTLHENS